MNRSILVFVAIAYALSIALSLVVGLTGGYQSPLIGLGIISMFLPAIAVLVVRSTMNEPPRIDWRRCPLGYIPVALLLMPVVMHAVMLPLAATLEGRLPWQEWLAPKADGLYYTPASRGWGTVPLPGLVARMAINAGIGLSTVSFLAFFEEVGWRALAAAAIRGSNWHTPRAIPHGGHLGILAHAVRPLRHPAPRWGLHHADGHDHAVGIVGSGRWTHTHEPWLVAG